MLLNGSCFVQYFISLSFNSSIQQKIFQEHEALGPDQSHQIQLNDVEPSHFHSILDLIYNGQTHIVMEEANKILETSKRLQIDFTLQWIPGQLVMISDGESNEERKQDVAGDVYVVADSEDEEGEEEVGKEFDETAVNDEPWEDSDGDEVVDITDVADESSTKFNEGEKQEEVEKKLETAVSDEPWEDSDEDEVVDTTDKADESSNKSEEGEKQDLAGKEEEVVETLDKTAIYEGSWEESDGSEYREESAVDLYNNFYVQVAGRASSRSSTMFILPDPDENTLDILSESKNPEESSVVEEIITDSSDAEVDGPEASNPSDPFDHFSFRHGLTDEIMNADNAENEDLSNQNHVSKISPKSSEIQKNVKTVAKSKKRKIGNKTKSNQSKKPKLATSYAAPKIRVLPEFPDRVCPFCATVLANPKNRVRHEKCCKRRPKNMCHFCSMLCCDQDDLFKHILKHSALKEI